MKAIILALGFLAVQAQAGWTEVSSVQREGAGPVGVSVILKEFSRYQMCSSLEDVMHEAIAEVAAGLPVDPVVTIFIKRSDYEWQGDTTCSEHDPRLYTVTCSGTVMKKTNGFSFHEELFDRDPCSTRNSPLKKTKKAIK